MSNPAGTTLGELMIRGETQFQQSIYDDGWNDCKEKILEVLKRPIQNCDLSWEEIDNRFIKKIEKL